MYMKTIYFLLLIAIGAAQSSPLWPSLPNVPSYRVHFDRRQDSKYPPIGQTPDPNTLPQSWRDALNAAVQQGKIPDIPRTTLQDGVPHYPNEDLAKSKEVCSWTTAKCFGDSDFHQAPDNTWILNFDDGPTPQSPDLYQFLQSQNQASTHFMIGGNIATYPDAFKKALDANVEIAVHTWSHPLTTTKTNEELVGEFGWTIQVIYDQSGRIPTLWRPPQGDLDNRVRAIAEHIFGLKAVMWSAECNDWCIQQDGSIAGACQNTDPGKSKQSIVDAINKAISQPKSPGVILLEHELTNPQIDIFKDAYPSVKQAGWNVVSASDALGKDWYANAKDDKGEAGKVDDIVKGNKQQDQPDDGGDQPGGEDDQSEVDDGDQSEGDDNEPAVEQTNDEKEEPEAASDDSQADDDGVFSAD